MIKSSYNIADEYYDLGGTLAQAHGKAGWPSITDEAGEKNTKIQMIQKPQSFEKLTNFSQKKPKLPEFCQSTKLIDLLGPESWILFHLKDTLREQHYIIWTLERFYKISYFFVDYCSERNIHLIKDFLQMYKSEDMKQNAM